MLCFCYKNRGKASWKLGFFLLLLLFFYFLVFVFGSHREDEIEGLKEMIACVCVYIHIYTYNLNVRKNFDWFWFYKPKTQIPFGNYNFHHHIFTHMDPVFLSYNSPPFYVSITLLPPRIYLYISMIIDLNNF